MDGLTLPYEERSGEHRIVAADAGSLREIVAALRMVSSSARSRGVSSTALAGALGELENAVRAAQSSIAGTLLPSIEVVALATGLHDEAERVSTAILTAATRALTDVGELLGRVRSARSLRASTRLELERKCDASATTLESVTLAIETLQRASVGHPIPLAVGDLLPADEPDAPPESRSGAPGLVHVRASRALDALVVVAAASGSAVLRQLVDEVAATHATDQIVLDAVREGRWLRVTIRAGSTGTPRHRWRRRTIDEGFGPGVARLAAAAAGMTIATADRGLDLSMPCA